MNLLSPLLLPGLLGVISSIRLCRRNSVPQTTALVLIMAIPLGLAMVSWLLFWSYVMAPASGPLLSKLLSGLILFVIGLPHLPRLAAFPFRKRLFHDGHESLRRVKKLFEQKIPFQRLIRLSLTVLSAYLFVYAFRYFYHYFLVKCLHNIHGGWDARYYWNLKARFFFRVPEQWTDMFSALLPPTDYPLFLPASIAWGWNWLGREALGWHPLIAFCFSVSLCFLMIWYLGTQTTLWGGFLAGSLLLTCYGYQFWSTTQYAEIPLTFFITATVLIATLACRQKAKRLYFLAGLLAGFAGWTKNEGLLFCFWTSLLLLPSIFAAKEKGLKEKLSAACLYLTGLFLPLTGTFFIKVALSQLGSGAALRLAETAQTGESYGPLILLQQVLAGDFSRVATVARVFYLPKLNIPDWNLIWFLFPLALLYNLLFRRQYFFSKYRWLIPVFILLIDLGYFIGLCSLPLSMLEHTLRYSLPRLSLHTTLLGIVFLFETFVLPVAAPLPFSPPSNGKHRRGEFAP